MVRIQFGLILRNQVGRNDSYRAGLHPRTYFYREVEAIRKALQADQIDPQDQVEIRFYNPHFDPHPWIAYSVRNVREVDWRVWSHWFTVGDTQGNKAVFLETLKQQIRDAAQPIPTVS